jgi:imidazolonepropionase-like amidohydrolase
VSGARLAVVAASIAVAFAGSAIAQDVILVRADRAWLSPERPVRLPSLLLENGKVADVVTRPAADQPDALASRAKTVLEFPGGVVTAGFVDVHCQALGSERHEESNAFTPELRAAFAYEPFAPRCERLLQRCVTSVVLSANDKNVAGGLAAWVKPGAGAKTGGEDIYLKLSLTEDARSRERRPTSLTGAVDLLRERYAALRGLEAGKLTPAERVLASTLGGRRAVGIAGRTPPEILAALELVAAYQLTAFLVHADEAAKVLPELKAAQIPVVLEPLGYDSSRDALALPSALRKASIPFAFAGESGEPRDTPRLQLALHIAVRRGLAEADAIAAVTTVPARIAGLQERVGALFQGRDADLVVWSADPWDLRARVLLVVRDGVIVHRAAVEATTANPIVHQPSSRD